MNVICPACGSEVPAERYCASCRKPLPADVARPADARVADFPIRAVARALDTLLAVLVAPAGVLIASVALHASGAPGDAKAWAAGMQELQPSGVAAAILGSSLYFALAEWIGAATLGKLICGLRVASQDFAPLRLDGALVRSFAVLVDGFLFGLPAYVSMSTSSLCQRLGDRWGGTIVVKRAQVPAAARPAGRAAAGIALGLAVWIALESYSLYQRALAAGVAAAAGL